MIRIFSNKTDSDSDQEGEQIERQEKILLPQMQDHLDMEKEYRKLMVVYEAGVQQLVAKLEILNKEFQFCNDRNPIENVKSRIKSQESILDKMKRKGLPLTISAMTNNIYDIAGVRVVCTFMEDVYQVARMLLSQRDVSLVNMKDYIKKPKENGYRSLHLIVLVDVFFSNQMQKVPVEIQLRTIAMNFWASAEHQLRYKKDHEYTNEMQNQLKHCADLMAEADMQMQELVEQQKYESAEQRN